VKIAYVFDLDIFKNINATHLICKTCVVIMCVKHVLHTKSMFQIRLNDLFMMLSDCSFCSLEIWAYL